MWPFPSRSHRWESLRGRMPDVLIEEMDNRELQWHTVRCRDCDAVAQVVLIDRLVIGIFPMQFARICVLPTGPRERDCDRS